MATYPPLAQKRRERVPSQPCSLTHRSQAKHAAHGVGYGPIKTDPNGIPTRYPPDTPKMALSRGAKKVAQNCPDWESY